MGTISIFSLDFSGTVFACSRTFEGSYRLQVGDFVVTMTPDEAAALARGGTFIRIKAQIASRFDRDLRPGVTYRRDLLAVDGRTAHLALGVNDCGDVFFGSGDARMTLTTQQAALLLAALNTLAADVSALYRATAGEPDGWGVARGMREVLDARLPPWARESE
jgi:hypothetical protein